MNRNVRKAESEYNSYARSESNPMLTVITGKGKLPKRVIELDCSCFKFETLYRS